MISRELFQELLRRRDAEFSRLCRVTSVFEDIFKTDSGKIIDTDALLSTLDLFYNAMTAALYAPENLIRVSLGLEDPEDTDLTEMEEQLPNGTTYLIHDYAELYDYIVERRKQLEAVNQ